MGRVQVAVEACLIRLITDTLYSILVLFCIRQCVSPTLLPGPC